MRDERVLWGPQHALYTVSRPVVLKLKLFVFAVFTAVRHTARYSVGSTGCPRIATGVLRDRGGLGGAQCKRGVSGTTQIFLRVFTDRPTTLTLFLS